MTNTTIANNLYPVANGTTSSLPFVDEFQPRDPTQYDIQYPIQKKWLNTVTNAFWELKNFTTSQGVLFANWVMIGAGIFTDTTYVEDTGDATPASGILYVLGSDGISTTGSGNTITISIPGGIPVTTYTENSGSATASGNILNVLGVNGITTSGSGNTITISSSGEFANTYVENTGSATPSGGVLNVLGTAGITTTGSGNTITIASTNINSVNVQTFTSSGTYTPTTNMVYCTIEVQGAGGGSGGVPTTAGGQYGIGGSGAGGGYARKTVIAATVGASQAVTIGTGGAAGSAGANAGGVGGTTSVGSIVSATGGTGGLAGIATANINSIASVSGGVGSSGDVNAYGGPSTLSIVGFPSMINSGSGGSSYFGGGASGSSGYSSASPGLNYGGGAVAATLNQSTSQAAGAAGANGIVVITEYIKA